MKKSLKTLSLNKAVVSELNAQNSNAVKGGMTVKTQADTLCTSNAIICHPSINFSCDSLFVC
ncbi:class I lanthipeptide [uncultured Kordia sp.]|uniref:class I lanthipeptide n=1 Tax=uncultured Kordia sp. TaxID=507699 RepID=UPI0026082B8F|nr:class I lanthipeptide [uncultured Kordia sp.]